MASIPDNIIDSKTVQAIYAAYEAAAAKEQPRRYLGASVIGGPCERAMWYDFRWCGREEFDGRKLRLFATGQAEEPRIVADLRAIGCEVHDHDERGNQFGVTALAGHFRGHLDGAVLGVPESPRTWHVLEMKTHNSRSFAALKAKGVKESKPAHFAQMQIYMHLTDMERALYFAVNKETDELYTERVKLDRDFAHGLIQKAKRIIESPRPPEPIGSDPEFYICRWCHHWERCYGLASVVAPVGINCRTCMHSTPITSGGGDGVWQCEQRGKPLSEPEQARGCDDHRLIPELICGAQLLDGDESDMSIEYENTPGGERWKNGAGQGQYRSVELTVLPVGQAGCGVVQAVKDMGATVSAI